MVKILSLLLIFLALSGCSTSSTSTPTAVAPASETPARHDLPTAAQASAPTSIPSRPTATSRAQTIVSPTDRPAATTRPMPSPTTASAFSATAPPAFSYPIGMPGRPLGDGFFIRHGAQVENTWYNPGYWHTGEDWYAIEGDTAGARVYAVSDGEVVYDDSDYPGRVVIVRHADDLYSMYGHLDPQLAVAVGQRIKRGELIGTVLRRDDKTPNHLHFEVRTFLTKPEVNGDAPRYPFRCGANCPPGPGYWPMNAPDLPSELGWRNPTHVINRRAYAGRTDIPLGEVVVATQPVSANIALWDAPPSEGVVPQSLGEVALAPGARYALVEISAGPEDSHETSAQAYQLWYRIVLPDERSGWVQAAVPSTFETGSDGRPSSVRFNFVPAIDAGL
jgi:murein DD-endopeptidase MepM/ murein hydrolase activator NlpD